MVFDFDVEQSNLPVQKADFNDAIALAKRNNIKVASSNDSFELWLVLHYQLVESELTRKELYKILNVKWDCNYEKLGKQYGFSRKIYQRLLEDKSASQEMAIKHANELEEMHKDKLPADKNPHTSIHLLVAELNTWIQT